jgi:hypothetical protein
MLTSSLRDTETKEGSSQHRELIISQVRQFLSQSTVFVSTASLTAAYASITTDIICDNTLNNRIIGAMTLGIPLILTRSENSSVD